MDSSSKSEHSPAVEKAEESDSQESVSYSDSSSDSDSDASHSNKKASREGAQGLPSDLPDVGDLFSNVQAPSFLSNHVRDLPQDLTMAKEETVVRRRAPLPSAADTATSIALPPPTASTTDQQQFDAKNFPFDPNDVGFKRSAEVGSEIMKRQKVGGGKGKGKVGTALPGQHETYKDRVKKQRMKGQSGMGEDFKTWRSEEEMRLRQHFD